MGNRLETQMGNSGNTNAGVDLGVKGMDSGPHSSLGSRAALGDNLSPLSLSAHLQKDRMPLKLRECNSGCRDVAGSSM